MRAPRLPRRPWATLPAFLLVHFCGAQSDTLIRAFTAFTDSFPSGHVALDLENDVLVLARAVGDSGCVRVHWRDAGGADQWNAIAVLSEGIRGFGHSIDLHNGLLAVGIDANDGSFNGPYGSVRIYRVDPFAPDPVVALDTLVLDAGDDAYPTDRFGRTVHWHDDMLLVGAVGRYHPLGTGAVYLFDRSGDQWQMCGLLQAGTDLQAPVLGSYGEVIASSPGRIVIGAPFSGYAESFSNLGSMNNVLGSLHFYRQVPGASDPCGWVPDGIAMDISHPPGQLSAFLTLETGRQGIAFCGSDLITHIAANYTVQAPDSSLDDEVRVRPPLRPACDHCGLRSFHENEIQPGIWTIADTSMLPIQDDLSMGLGAWAVHDQLLFVNQFDRTLDVWSTRVHSHYTGNWVEIMTIAGTQPMSDTAYNTPLVADGPWLVRLPSTLDQSDGAIRTIGVEIFHLGAWTGMNDEAPASHRLLPYPDPAPGVCTVELPDGKRWTLSVFDPMGRAVRAYAPCASGRVTLDLSGVSPGTYSLVALEGPGVRRLFGTIAVQAP
jgi:hypothetical protein